jgi:hypothetical protein
LLHPAIRARSRKRKPWWTQSAQMLIRYLRVTPDALGKSLDDANIEVDIDARPIFLDNRPAWRTSVSVPTRTASSHSVAT